MTREGDGWELQARRVVVAEGRVIQNDTVAASGNERPFERACELARGGYTAWIFTRHGRAQETVLRLEVTVVPSLCRGGYRVIEAQRELR